MEIKVEKEVNVGKLEGGLFVVGTMVCATWSAAMKALTTQMGIPVKPRKPRAKK